MASIDRLFLTGLQYLYGAHQQSARQAAESEATSSSTQLKRGARIGAKRNKVQIERLEKVFKTLGVHPTGYQDGGMQGILEANRAQISRTADPKERDLINISSMQTAAHFYITKYGTLRAYAEELGNSKAAALLEKNEAELARADKMSTGLAQKLMAGMNPSRKTSLFSKVLSTAAGLGAIAALTASTLPVLGSVSRK